LPTVATTYAVAHPVEIESAYDYPNPSTVYVVERPQTCVGGLFLEKARSAERSSAERWGDKLPL
jgi:hypothetical protein